MFPEKGETDYSKIDGGIVELVYRLNGVPGVRTMGSCQGDIQKFYPLQSVENAESHTEYIPADHGKVFLRRGFITFTIDESVHEARNLKSELTQYAKDNRHTSFGIWKPGPPQDVYTFDLVLNDLLSKIEKVPETDLHAAIKNECQLTYQEALQRYIDWHKSLLDLVPIVDKYQKHHQ